MKTLYAFSFFALISCFSCKKEHLCDCLKSTGDIVQEERSPGTFNTIELHGNINVFVTQDSLFKVTVEAGSHLIEGIKTEVTGSTLKISNENRCNFVRSYKKPVNVYLSLPRLSELIHKGSGKVSSTNTLSGTELVTNTWSSGDMELKVDVGTLRLKLHVNSGDVTVSGKAGTSYVNSNGNGFVNAQSLKTDSTYLSTQSTGQCYIDVAQKLYLWILWTGDVYYSGNPSIEAEYRGKGHLYPL